MPTSGPERLGPDPRPDDQKLWDPTMQAMGRDERRALQDERLRGLEQICVWAFDDEPFHSTAVSSQAPGRGSSCRLGVCARRRRCPSHRLLVLAWRLRSRSSTTISPSGAEQNELRSR